MTDKEIISFLGKSGLHICINIENYYNSFMNPNQDSNCIIESNILRVQIQSGFYGKLESGAGCYCSRNVPPDYVSIFPMGSLPKDGYDSQWSSPISFNEFNTSDDIERFLKLKSFW